MTNEEMKTCIEECAQAALNAGQTVEINNVLPYVAVKLAEDSEYFFQGQEASELLDEHEASADKFNVTVEQSILHSAQGW